MITKIKLVIFDVDSVLLDTELGATIDILVSLGLVDEIARLNREHEAGQKSGPLGTPELISLYKDFEMSVLNFSAENYCEEKLMPGAREAIADIRSRGIKVGVISSCPIFVLNVLKKKLNSDFVAGLDIEFISKVSTGHIDKVIDRNEKAKLLSAKIVEFGLRNAEVMIVASSDTNLPMVSESGKFIAFNPAPEVIEKANVVIRKKDLREITNYI